MREVKVLSCQPFCLPPHLVHPLPGSLEGLVLLLVQLCDQLTDLGLVVLHYPLLLHQIVELQSVKR